MNKPCGRMEVWQRLHKSTRSSWFTSGSPVHRQDRQRVLEDLRNLAHSHRKSFLFWMKMESKPRSYQAGITIQKHLMGLQALKSSHRARMLLSSSFVQDAFPWLPTLLSLLCRGWYWGPQQKLVSEKATEQVNADRGLEVRFSLPPPAMDSSLILKSAP